MRQNPDSIFGCKVKDLFKVIHCAKVRGRWKDAITLKATIRRESGQREPPVDTFITWNWFVWYSFSF